MRFVKLALFAIILSIVTAQTSAFAWVRSDGEVAFTVSMTEEYEQSSWTSEIDYPAQVMMKLIFGAKNLLLGWTDLFTEPNHSSEIGEAGTIGMMRGLKDTFLNTIGGALHLATFPITSFDPTLPQGGVKF